MGYWCSMGFVRWGLLFLSWLVGRENGIYLTIYKYWTWLHNDIQCLILYWFNHHGAFNNFHDDVMKWKLFPRHWPFVRGIHRSPVNSPHKGQWRGALMFSLICAWINGWVNNREAGDLRRHRADYDVIVMLTAWFSGLKYTRVRLSKAVVPVMDRRLHTRNNCLV